MKLDIKKILVPVDFSETSTVVLSHAGFLARLSKAELVLVYVHSINPFYFEIPEPTMAVGTHDDIYKLVDEKLAELSKKIDLDYGIKPKCVTRTGTIANEIIHAAREEQVSLIMMGTHGAKGFEELFLGSNAHKVVTIAPCPVITVQEHAKTPGFINIVLPIDHSAHSREKVEIAISFGKLYTSKIHILGLLEETEDHEYDKLQIILDQVQHAIEKAGLPFTRHTVKGDNLAREALKYGTTVNADLIMIMTDHESKLTGIFLGPIAKQIVNHSRIPVMSIKPHYGSFEKLNLEGGATFY